MDMELSKDQATAMRQVIEVLEAAQKDAANAATDFGLRNGWVVCFEDDFSAMTHNKQLNQIGAMVGGKLFVANSAHYADNVKRTLQAKTDKRLITLPVSVWSEKRVAVYTKLIASWKQQAAEQGIKLEVA
jgi:hypothetical protein